MSPQVVPRRVDLVPLIVRGRSVYHQKIIAFSRFNRHSRASTSVRSDTLAEDEEHHVFEMSTNDLFIKDAFLVFRALCKLTMKPLNQERLVDI